MSKILKGGSLFISMYIASAAIIAMETGSWITALKIALFTSTIKSVIAISHSWWWSEPTIVVEAVCHAVEDVTV